MNRTILIAASTLLIFFVYIFAKSLWNPDSNLFSDKKNVKIGDTIKIVFNEKSIVKYKIATEETEKSAISGGAGMSTSLSFLPVLSGADNTKYGQSAGTKTDGEIQTAITVRVANVLPNGHLQISGNHNLIVNNQQEQISITGIVNPKKIRSDGSVLSTDIADVSIIYRAAILKPDMVTEADYIFAQQAAMTNITTGTQAGPSAPQTGLSEAKKRELIIKYINKILPSLFK